VLMAYRRRFLQVRWLLTAVTIILTAILRYSGASTISRRDTVHHLMLGDTSSHQAGTDNVSVSNRRSISIRKPNMDDKPKIPQHNCKVDYYETTDAEGRVWQVEHRH